MEENKIEGESWDLLCIGGDTYREILSEEVQAFVEQYDGKIIKRPVSKCTMEEIRLVQRVFGKPYRKEEIKED